MIQPIVLAGGSGTRLWPLSRALLPKQFLKLNSEYSLIQNTILRHQSLECYLPITICNEQHRFVVAEQLREISQLGPIILEPQGRNTAPAIAIAALSCLAKNTDPILLVLASDHVIEETQKYTKVINNSLPLAQQGKLVTFGVVPNHPETGYGYIKKAAPIANECGPAFTVAEFIEKPDSEHAKHYLEQGDYLWNSGMFMFKASRYLEELGKYRTDILESCQQAFMQTQADLDFIRVNQQAFLECPAQSIDYAVMEHTADAVVVPLDANWRDIGSFNSIWESGNKDQHGNVHQGDVLSHNSHNNLVMAENNLVTTVGLDNTIVIQTKDAVLVAAKHQGQSVKEIVAQIRALKRPEADLHRQVFRPWGSYDGVDFGERHQVKHIVVNPKEKLSLQMHHHRAEHWIVVSGIAQVTKDKEIFMLTENESTYIAAGTLHALENPTDEPLHLIEVQTGQYFGEDDIIRFEDKYGRLPCKKSKDNN